MADMAVISVVSLFLYCECFLIADLVVSLLTSENK